MGPRAVHRAWRPCNFATALFSVVGAVFALKAFTSLVAVTEFKEQLASLMPIMNQSWTPDALHPVRTSCGTD